MSSSMAVDEGDRVSSGALVAELDTTDTEIAIRRAEAERAQAVAQLRLLQAGPRPEDIRQARAQAESAQADVAAAEVGAAVRRCRSGRDSRRCSHRTPDPESSATTRRRGVMWQPPASRRRRTECVRQTKRSPASGPVRAAKRSPRRKPASTRSMPRWRRLRKSQADARVLSPVAGIVTSRLVDPGEIVAPRAPLVVVTDLDRAWANVYVDEPVVARLKLGQTIPIVTDARQRLDGTVTFISPKAEFTPRNVQTAEERTKLVYRIKVTTDNKQGVLKSGMPVEAEIPR